jgi:phospholipid/cholesterol/gamma-HCH transport system substrate-binding protein
MALSRLIEKGKRIMNRFPIQARVGLFFLISISILAYVWFRVLDFSFREGFLLKASFRSVEGISQGSQIQIAGIKVGQVKDIVFDPDTGKASVAMIINDAYKNIIPEGSRVLVKTKGLLGDKYLVIEPGKPNARKLKTGEEIKSVFEPTDTQKMFESLAVVSQDLQAITSVTKKQLVDEKGSERIDNILNNTNAVTTEAKNILTRNRDKINQTVDNADSATKGVNEIVSLNKNRINHTVSNFETFSKSIDKTGGKFDQIASDLDGITKDLRSGRGTLGKLVNDDSLYRDAQALVRDVRGISNRIQHGPGTVGRLINDPEMYFEARRAVRNMNKTAEEISEVTPVSTLAIILGSFFR